MKYVITQEFSFTGKKFEIINDSKLVCTVKATSAVQYTDQFDVKLSNLTSEALGDISCIIECDANSPRNYLIYSVNDQTKEKLLFGQLFYQVFHHNNYQYTIIIGRKLYKVSSSDLKNRRLAIIDACQSSNAFNPNEYKTANCPKTLFQVIDSFSKTNKKYHVNIHQKEWPLGYLAITILLHLHESQKSDI